VSGSSPRSEYMDEPGAAQPARAARGKPGNASASVGPSGKWNWDDLSKRHPCRVDLPVPNQTKFESRSRCEVDETKKMGTPTASSTEVEGSGSRTVASCMATDSAPSVLFQVDSFPNGSPRLSGLRTVNSDSDSETVYSVGIESPRPSMSGSI
jgi:hypothetical protein